MDDQKAIDAMFYVLHTDRQWKALARSLGASSTAHAHFYEGRKAGMSEKLWPVRLLEKKGLNWGYVGRRRPRRVTLR